MVTCKGEKRLVVPNSRVSGEETYSKGDRVLSEETESKFYDLM